MGKSVIINQDKLLMLKETMASNGKIVSHKDICVNEAAPEVDEYEIGGEENAPIGGVYYHVNENRYDDLYNKTYYDLQSFTKQCAAKYGNEWWYLTSYMKRTHPEIEIDKKDVDIYNALYAKHKEISKLWNEEDNKEEGENFKEPTDYYDVINLAKEKYGITNNISQAGYILPDGGLLSFGADGYRDVDHRAIEAIYEENNIPIWSDEYRYNYVVDFMNHGAIRCDIITGILDMTQEPTSEQYNTIKSFVRKAVDIDIDFTDDKGNTLHSVSYSDARPQQVVADIRRYYNEGIKPQGNIQYEEKKRKGVMMSESQIKLLMEGYKKNIPQEFIDMAVKFRKNKYTNWCVVDLVSAHRFPRYFEKKEVAVRYMKTLRQFGDKPALINLDALNGINENVDFLTSNLITESQESKSIAAAKKLVMQRLGYNSQEADEFIRIKLRNDIPSLRTPQGGKFILGVTRMFCDGELRNANDIGNLNSTLKLIASDAHINEYDRNLNNLSCQELIQRFAKAMSDNLDAEKDEVNKMVFDSPSDYEIVRIDSFEQAEEYGDYVSWCVTHDESMFNSYTSDGINQFYFCLKNGFENVEEVESEGCPLDEYGLSMIAVSVNGDGMLNTCTCRWNHSNGGDDSIMDAKEISQVIGMNFFEVFKPNNKWKDLLDSVMQRLANGEDPRDVFDYVGDFNNGFAKIKLNGKWNFINQKGKLLSDQWLDNVGNFKEGFGWVKLNNKFNFINQEGRFLSSQWFDYVSIFCEGFARVTLNGKHNFINQEGRLISNQWFDDVDDFYEGFARVNLNWKWNLINQEGRLLSDQWFDIVYDFREGLAMVELNRKYNFINQEGRVISNQWFDYAYNFVHGFAEVKLNYKWNYINQEGRLLSDQWFNFARSFCEGFATVGLNGKCNFINKEGRFLSDQWFNNVYNFRDGFAMVELNGKTYKIDTNGKLYEGKNKRKNIIISENKIKLLKENLDLEVDSSEIDLSSFKKKDELVPSIWDEDDKLNSKIRLKLLDIADDFWDFVNLKWVKPKGVILTGSICNFNWSKYSDIDLHIIADFNEIDEKTEFVRDYLDSKKNEWNNEHNSLEIMGYKVELYVQDLDEMPQSSGIYDLEENDWISKPNPNDIEAIGMNKYQIKEKAAKIMTIIDDMFDILTSTSDSHKIEEISNDADYLWKKVKGMRKSSLEKDGEMGAGNIVYKYMRRKGYLDKLWKLRTMCYDKSNSIMEDKNIVQYITSLKNSFINEEFALDGNTEHNPYKDRWKAEREALKNYISHYGVVMQSKEDNKEGKLYKVLWDKGISQLIGYNYCLCVQWDEIKLKPKSVVYVRAMDKFTPNIRRNITFDNRGLDNQAGTWDDVRY